MKKKSALLVSISMVLVAVLALTTASFAWFSASMNPSLGGFDLNVTTAEALLVGVNTGNYTDIKYKTSLTNAEVITATGGVFVGSGDTLSEATPKSVTGTDPNKTLVLNNAANPIDFYQLQTMDVPTFAGDGTNDAAVYKAADNSGTEKRYVKFDLYFKANFGGSNNAIDVKLAMKSGQTGVNKLAKFTALDPTTGAEIVYDSTSGKTDEDQPKIYWITAAMRTAFVAAPVSDAAGTIGTLEAAKVLEIDSRTAPITAPSIDAFRQYKPTTDVNGAYITGNTAADKRDEDMALFTMPNNSVYRLTVYLWIEGNDTHCDNEISASRFMADYAFTGVQQP